MEEPKKELVEYGEVRSATIKPITPEIISELLDAQEKKILIHHIPERKLWLTQREAGTNEQWQRQVEGCSDWVDLLNDVEPRWYEHHKYRVKPKTVKYYFCLCRRKNGDIVSMSRTSKDRLKYAVGDATIIGNIEERDVEV